MTTIINRFAGSPIATICLKIKEKYDQERPIACASLDGLFE